MINLVIPMAGVGQRFINAGYKLPKPLITIGTKTNIEWSMSCIKPSADTQLFFIIRRDQELNHSLGTILKQKFGPKSFIVELPAHTSGAVDTVLQAKNVISYTDPLMIYCPDVFFEPTLEISESWFDGCDGHILTFKANSPNYSYVELNGEGFATRTVEKQVISPNAAVGLYMYTTGQAFFEAAQKMIARNDRTNNEFYLCPTYNYLIQEGKKVKTTNVDKMHVFGTPEEMSFFEQCSIRTFFEHKFQRKIALCADHSGFEAKEKMKEIIRRTGLSFVDFGTFSSRDCDYTTFVEEACYSVLDNTCAFGMGFCRTGQGVNITANKMPGIRSALVFDDYTAAHAIKHNCANFFSVSSKYASNLEEILLAWLTNTFDGGRHQNRLQELE